MSFNLDNTRNVYLCAKYQAIGKLNTKIKKIKKMVKQDNQQCKDFLSELEVINSIERLLDISISDENIDQKITKDSNKDADISIDFNHRKIFFEVMNLLNLETHKSSSTKEDVTISDPEQWIETIRYKILNKILDKTTGFTIKNFNTPFILVLGPYSDDWITIEPGYVFQAMHSIFTWDLDFQTLTPDDIERDPFKEFEKARQLLSGVLITKFSTRGSEPDLFLWYIENPQCKKDNRIPEKLVRYINNENNKKVFKLKLIPPKAQWRRLPESSDE